MTPAM